jgi:tungstate transport system permease protein
MLEIVVLSFWVSGWALLWACIIGIPLGTWLGLFPPRHKVVNWLVSAVVFTGMGLPPVVVGLVVYLFLSRSGILGGLGWLFTPLGMIFAQTILAVPLVLGFTQSALEALDPDLRLQMRSLGASRWQESLTALREVQNGLVAAILAGFGAIISEVGAVMLVGGNIEGATRVLTTAIVLETRKGNFELALGLGAILLSLVLSTNLLILRLRKG